MSDVGRVSEGWVQESRTGGFDDAIRGARAARALSGKEHEQRVNAARAPRHHYVGPNVDQEVKVGDRLVSFANRTPSFDRITGMGDDHMMIRNEDPKVGRGKPTKIHISAFGRYSKAPASGDALTETYKEHRGHGASHLGAVLATSDHHGVDPGDVERHLRAQGIKSDDLKESFMGDVGRIGESFRGLEEAWSVKARLAALEARRRKRGLGGETPLGRGLGRAEAGLTGNADLASSGADRVASAFRGSGVRSDAELFPGEAAHKAIVSGTRHSYDVGAHTVHVHNDGTARVTDSGSRTVFHGTQSAAHAHANALNAEAPLTPDEKRRYLENYVSMGDRLVAKVRGKDLAAHPGEARAAMARGDADSRKAAHAYETRRAARAAARYARL